MSNYSQNTFFAPKDNLATGNASKKILGSEMDAELDEISTAIASKSEGDLPSGTQLIFIMSALPSGWTLVTGFDGRAVILEDTEAQGTDTAGNWTISNTEINMSGAVGAHTHAPGNYTVNNPGQGITVNSGGNIVGIEGNHSVIGSSGNMNTSPNVTSAPANGTMANGNWKPAHVKAIVGNKD